MSQPPKASAKSWRTRIVSWCIRLTLLGVLALLLGITVLIVRALSLKSQQFPVAPIEHPAVNEKAVERLAGALRFRTVSAPGDFRAESFQSLHQYLADQFPRVHSQLQREVVAECSLLYRWAGSDPKSQPILLMSHLDVVPVPEMELPRWTHSPWGGAVADGYVWGRGAMDVKCGALSQLEAIEHLLGQGFQPKQDIYLAFGHDEEVGGNDGNLQISLMLRQRGVRFRFVLDEGGVIVEGAMPGLHSPLALVAVAEKGYATVQLSVDVEPGHSSMPPAHTAVGILAAAVTKLEDKPLPASLSGPVGLMLDTIAPEMDFTPRVLLANRDVLSPVLLQRFAQSPALNALTRTTTAATVFQGGRQENALPGHAEALVNFRLLSGDLPELVLAHVRQVVDDERVKCELRSGALPPSSISDHRSADFLTLQRVIRQVFPDVVVAPGLAVVATDSRHYEGISENIYRFLPVQVQVDDLKRIHGIDERISVENYRRMVEFMILLLRQSAESPA
jgi:carboxypeptidase PM20D1